MLSFSLLIACCHHHHHHDNCNPVSRIDSFEKVDFDQIDENALVVFTKQLSKFIIQRLKFRRIKTHEYKTLKNLKEVFRKTGCHFNKIIFFDDNEKNIMFVAKAAEDLGVAYRGYICKGRLYNKTGCSQSKRMNGHYG